MKRKDEFESSLRRSAYSNTTTKRTSISSSSRTSRGTAVVSPCPSSCSFDGPLITGYHWVPVVGNQTLTATLEIIVAPVTVNVSGPYAVNQSRFTSVDEQTEYNHIPPEVTIPLVDGDGSALALATTTGADGLPTGTYVAYPTSILDYPSSFDLSGVLPTATAGSSICHSGGEPETLTSHPTYSQPT